MLLRRSLVAAAAAGLPLALSVPGAGADAAPRGGNCLGAAFSALVPEETSTAPPSYGQTTRGQAADQQRDDLITAATGALAGCP